MDVARLNMSHGSYEDHERNYRLVRQASDESGHGVGIFADLQGPKIRLETFAEGPVKLKKGQSWTITTRDVRGDATECGTTYKGLPDDVSEGDPILIDDGKVRLSVDSVDDGDVRTTVVVGGQVSDHKGINLPGVAVSVPALSEKDVEDLRWALRMGVDFVALSFVRSAADVDDVHKVMDEEGRRVLAPGQHPRRVGEAVLRGDRRDDLARDAAGPRGALLGRAPVHAVERVVPGDERRDVRREEEPQLDARGTAQVERLRHGPAGARLGGAAQGLLEDLGVVGQLGHDGGEEDADRHLLAREHADRAVALGRVAAAHALEDAVRAALGRQVHVGERCSSKPWARISAASKKSGCGLV